MTSKRRSFARVVGGGIRGMTFLSKTLRDGHCGHNAAVVAVNDRGDIMNERTNRTLTAIGAAGHWSGVPRLRRSWSTCGNIRALDAVCRILCCWSSTISNRV